jgi:DNA-binding HxlR family transcriptional regulator
MSDFDYSQFDAFLNSRVRLAVMATLSSVEEAEFIFLCERIGATDSDHLGKHLRELEDAGYIAVEKTFERRKPVSRYSLTQKGREAFSVYRERMEQLIRELDV